MNKNNRMTKIVLTAMFSALCCAATFIQIRMPSGDFVHLGNFVMIIAALLLGGLIGGISGSLGMGIYDLIYYSSKPSTIIRTFILKFIVGFLVGYIFRLIIKKELNSKKILYILSILFFVVFATSLTLFICGDFSSYSFDNGLSSIFIIGSAKLKISLYIPIFAFLFFVGSLISALLSKKLSKRSMAALVAVLIAIFTNILGEFFIRFLLEGIMLDGFNKSLITATSKIPGSIITGFISVLLTILIYEPIYRAIKNTSLVENLDDDNDDLDTKEDNIITEEEINEINDENNK